MVGPGLAVKILRSQAPRVVPKGQLVLKVRVTKSYDWAQSRFGERKVLVLAVVAGHYSGRTVDIDGWMLSNGMMLTDCDHMVWTAGDWFTVGTVQKDRAGKSVLRPVAIR